ncbi:MAG: DUF2550 domain-containing protein [Sporichthyaceae bacterium]|nr:DUF2550 domain-containing protein [Sporichthyaceae bacterium]
MGTVLRIVVAVAAAGLLLLFALAARRIFLRRRVGTFDCSLRLTSGKSGKYGRGWLFGLARYSGDGLAWYRVFSFSPRPRYVYPRRELTVRGQRKPTGPEAMALLSGAVVLECGVAGQRVELGMSPAAVTGFLAWLESAPPGHHLVA